MKHRHHIIPRHAGGTDDPANIVLLTIEEHAEAHRILYEEHGRWQDYAAWMGLSGLVDSQDMWEFATRLGREKWMQDPERMAAHGAKVSASLQEWYDNGGAPWNKGRTDCWKISENVKRQAREGNFHCIGDYQRGRTFGESHKDKLSERALKRTKVQCVHCDIIVSPAMHKRWHGDNCRRR